MPRSTSGKMGKGTSANKGGLGQLFQLTPLPMWVYDLETLAFLAVNNAAVETYGFSEEEFLRMSIKDIHLQSDVPTLGEFLDITRSADKDPNEWLHRTKDGRILTAAITRKLVDYQDRKAVLVVAQNITSQKISEQALRESEGRLRQQAELIEHVTDAIISCDLGFHIITWNRAAETIYGWKTAEVIVEDLDELTQTKYLGTTREKALDELFTSGQWSGELEQQRKDGTPIFVQSRIAIVRNQNSVPVKLVCVNRDISERRVVEQALRKSEERFRILAETAPDVIYLYGLLPEPSFAYVSPSATVISGYTPEEHYADPQLGYKLVHPAERHLLEETNQGNLGNSKLTLRWVRKDGQIIWVEQRNVLIRDQNGTLVAVQSIARDITEAKNRERDLEALYQSGVSLRQVSNPKAVARKVIELLEQHMEWHHAAVWIRREHSENIEQLAYSQVYSTEDTLRREKAKSRALVHNIHTGLAGWVVGHGETVRKGDVASDPRYAKINESVRSGLYVPIKMGQETIGCISAESMRPDAFSAHDERLLTTVAAQAAIALENARLYQASRQAAMRRDVLYRASQEIAQASQDIEKVYETVCRTAKKLMPAEVFTISRVTPGQSEIQGVYLVDKGKRLPPLSVPFGEGLAGKVIADGKPIIISDFLAQTEIKTIKIGGSKARARSVLAVPMRVGNEIMGAISVQSYQPGVYSDDDAVLLGMLASYTGVTIQNADLFEQTRFRAAQLVRINDLGRAMAETFDLIEIYTRLARIALDLIPGSATLYISLFNPLTREIRAAYSVHDGETLDVSALPTVPLSPPGEGTQSQAIHTGKPVIIDDLGKVYQKGKLKVTRIGTEGPSTQSGIFVPMVAHGTVIGVLQLQSYARAHYSPADAELLSLVANTAAVSIENARLYDKTRRNAEQLSQLNALGRELATTISPASIYHTTHAYVRQFLDCPDLGIFLLDSIEQDLRPVFLIVNGQEIDVTAPFPMHQERSQAQVIQSGRTKAVATAFPVILNDLSLEPGMSTRGEDQPHPQSVIYTPMVVDGVVVGILEVHSYRRDAYSEEDADLLSTIANPIGLSIKNARLFTQIERQVTQLSALRTIDNAISSNTDLNTTLSIILEQVKTELGVDAVDILLFKPETMTLEHVANRGFHTDAIYNISLRLGEGIAGKTALERKPLVIEDLVNVNIDNLTHYDGLLSAEQFVAYANAPLVSKGQLKGVLEVFQRTFLNVDSDWLTFLEMMGNEAAIAIDNADLFNELQRSNLDLTIAYDATIEGWSQTLELRESPSASRGRLVTDMTLRLARIMNIQGLELIHIRRGSLLHDVGKMGVPDHILKKPGPLNEAEWQIVRQHPVLAHSLLSRISYLRPALDIPYCHHERWDGTGYPRKLRGEQIPLSARVFAVVDVYNALVSDRSYRKALPQAEAFKYLREQAGGQFDPAVVEMFLKMMEADEMPD